MTSDQENAVRWEKHAPLTARPLRELLLCHPVIIRRVIKLVGAKGEVRQADREKISIDHTDGDRGFEVTEQGIEPWVVDANWTADDEDDRRWLPIIQPWVANDGLFSSIWFFALQEFDWLLRSGRIELSGRFESLRAPSSYIPPGGLPDEIWTSSRVDFAKGTFALNNGEIVYDVHVLPTEGAGDKAIASDEKWTVDQLAQWIGVGFAKSPSEATFSKRGLAERAHRIGLADNDVDAAWRLAKDRNPEVAKIYGHAGRRRRAIESYPGIDF